MIGEVLINGESSDGKVPVNDSAVLRGDGCFEVVKAYGGEPFALEDHLDRLQLSASALHIDLPLRDDIEKWVVTTAERLGDCLVRVLVTRGSMFEGSDEPTRVIVFGHPWPPQKEQARLYPVPAPWHAAGVEWDLAGAKTLSYAPNVAATRRAQLESYDDALLMTTEGLMLEGPTFSVAWVIDGVIETPTLEMGILDSITRQVVLDLANDFGLTVLKGSWGLERLEAATEMMALSTIREVQSVGAVGDLSFEPGPVTEMLSEAFKRLVR